MFWLWPTPGKANSELGPLAPVRRPSGNRIITRDSEPVRLTSSDALSQPLPPGPVGVELTCERVTALSILGRIRQNRSDCDLKDCFSGSSRAMRNGNWLPRGSQWSPGQKSLRKLWRTRRSWTVMRARPSESAGTRCTLGFRSPGNSLHDLRVFAPDAGSLPGGHLVWRLRQSLPGILLIRDGSAEDRASVPRS